MHIDVCKYVCEGWAGAKEEEILMMKIRKKAQQEVDIIIELNCYNICFSNLGNEWCVLSRRK